MFNKHITNFFIILTLGMSLLGCSKEYYVVAYNLNDGIWKSKFTPQTSNRVNKKIKLPNGKEIQKNGYIFSGWDIAPSTMPAKDLTIRGSYVTLSGLFEITDKNGTRTNPIIVDMFGRHYNEFEKLNRGIYIVNGRKVFVT